MRTPKPTSLPEGAYVMTAELPGTERNEPPRQPAYPPTPMPHPDTEHSQEGHSGHRWMMIACCIPMLVIVGILVATPPLTHLNR